MFRSCRKTILPWLILFGINNAGIFEAMKKSLFVIYLSLALSGVIAVCSLHAQVYEDPFHGYTQYTNSDSSFYMPYANSTSFGTGSDVQIAVTIGGIKTLDVTMDTGSRGFYADSTTLGPSFQTNAGSFWGEEGLSSSGKASEGYWTPTTVSFAVTDQYGNRTNISEIIPILDVQDIKATKDNVDVTMNTTTGTATVVDTNGTFMTNFTSNTVTLQSGQKMCFSNNALVGGANFGIGFDLNGQGTGPITNNFNQIYNPLLGFSSMTNGTMVAGYVVQKDGIQIGLSATNTGFAYTQLNPTGLTTTNSVPDWQTPTGQVVYNGVTNGPGSVVLDSGIGYAYFSAPGYSNQVFSNPAMTIQLINSGTNVSYSITSDTSNVLNPSFDNSNAKDYSNNVFCSVPATNGIYSQNMAPYGSQYFNSGRNVFNAFDMLYDASNGYIGLITNTSNPNVTFNAGFYPSAVPEPSTCILFGFGALALVIASRERRRK